MNDYQYIAIEGVIGVGKTTLIQNLAKNHNFQAIYEEFDAFELLKLFYENPERWCFALEMKFLHSRKKLLSQIPQSKSLVISDFSYIKPLVFAYVNLAGVELELFMNFWKEYRDMLPKPQKIIYLNSDLSSIYQNIKQRNRVYEVNIALDYLEKIHLSYLKVLQDKDLMNDVDINIVNYCIDNQEDNIILLNSILKTSL
ncbi:MAG: deoxynucleoside kinase [Chitinophagales bacterium]|jgi:deoxyadenosine/deoxycytidine kinase|nr:deoxynucleoside kinase [Chitinophagales bacterium]